MLQSKGVCLENWCAKQKLLKVSGTHFQVMHSELGLTVSQEKSHLTQNLFMILFFRMMFSHRKWSCLQLFCSFWTGDTTVQNTSQLVWKHSLSYQLLFAELLKVAWAAVQCAPLQHFRLFSSSWSMLKSARATCRRRNSSAQGCCSKGRA